MARNSDEKSKFLQILSETPFIHYACKKVVISRATIYRWMKGNPDFAKAVRKALQDGRNQLVELAELTLVKKIREGDRQATEFFLIYNTKRYAKKRPILLAPSISTEQREEYRTVYEWAIRNQAMPKEVRENVFRAFKNWGYFDSEGRVTSKFKNDFGNLTKENAS